MKVPHDRLFEITETELQSGAMDERYASHFQTKVARAPGGSE